MISIPLVSKNESYSKSYLGGFSRVWGWGKWIQCILQLYFIFASSGSLGWLSHGLWLLSLLRSLVSFPVNTLLHRIQGTHSSRDQGHRASFHKLSSKAPSQDPSPSYEDSVVPPTATQHGFLQTRSVPRTDLPGNSLCSAYEPVFTEMGLEAPPTSFSEAQFQGINQTTVHKNDS